jgi:hypothetical protein
LELVQAPSDHSTISRTRRLNDREVFTWILKRLAEAGLAKGQRIGMDATTLEANAALRRIVRRDTGESYQEFLSRLTHVNSLPRAVGLNCELISNLIIPLYRAHRDSNQLCLSRALLALFMRIVLCTLL